MRIFCFFLVMISFAACKNGVELRSTTNDTIEVVKKIIDDKYLMDFLNKKPDTIFIIKSRNFNKSWPSKTNKFKIGYVERTKKNENLIDLSPQSWNDERTRMDFGTFIFNEDTAHVSLGLYQFQDFSIYDYKLKYENEQWIIIKVNKKS